MMNIRWLSVSEECLPLASLKCIRTLDVFRHKGVFATAKFLDPVAPGPHQITC
jgi:hypothetical protein